MAPTFAIPAALAGTQIMFTRSTGAWPPPAFTIDPDGSHESALEGPGLHPGVPSPTGMQIAIGVIVDRHSKPSDGDDSWVRPALVAPGSSELRVLDGYPGRNLNLLPIGWSADASRILVMSGYDATDLHDVGLFSVRASDGGDLTTILPSPVDVTASGIAGESCARPDAIQPSPDRSKLLVDRQTPEDVCGTVLVYNADGSGEVRLNPEGTIAVDLDIWDYLERGRISESWAHDGGSIAFGAFVESADSTALFVADPEGTEVRQIVPPNVGAVTATWSPDDAWIAFTSRLRESPQVWRVHPDGSGLQQLTDGTDGSTSVMPVWSPDGSRLLFERKRFGQVSMWTMNADGTGASQLSPTPVGSDYYGPYAWWPTALG